MKKLKKILTLLLLTSLVFTLALACTSCSDFNIDFPTGGVSFYDKIHVGDKIIDDENDLTETLTLKVPEDIDGELKKYTIKITITMRDGYDPHTIKYEGGTVTYNEETGTAVVTVIGSKEDLHKSTELSDDITAWAKNRKVKDVEIEIEQQILTNTMI